MTLSFVCKCIHYTPPSQKQAKGNQNLQLEDICNIKSWKQGHDTFCNSNTTNVCRNLTMTIHPPHTPY